MTIAQEPSVETALVDVTSQIENPPCRILFKNEYEQPSGSFKLRGMSYLLAKSVEEARKQNRKGIHAFSSSGGNAGLAVAYASRHMGIPCTVVLPEISKPVIIEKLKTFGAEVVVHGKHWGEADEYLRTDLIKSLDDRIYPVYCHPFDNPLVWEGHGQMIDEIVDQLLPEELKRVKGVAVSAGGGGLYNGVVYGLEKHGLDAPVLVLETDTTPSFQKAVEAGKLVKLDKIVTLATSLGAPLISQKSLDNYHSHKTFVEVLSDLDAAKGTIDFHDKFGHTVEPACGVTLSAVFDHSELLQKFAPLEPEDIVILIVCGGWGVSPATLEEYRELVAKA